MGFAYLSSSPILQNKKGRRQLGDPSRFAMARYGLCNRAAGGLDLGLCSRAAGNLDRELLRDLAGRENLDLRTLVVRESGLDERLDGDLGAGLELLLEIDKVDAESLGVEAGVVEATLGQTADERHLATLEAELLLVTLAGVLALVATRRSLAHARTASATDALAAFAGTRRVRKIREIHCLLPFPLTHGRRRFPLRSGASRGR